MADKPLEKGEYAIGFAILLAALLISATVYVGVGNVKSAIEAKFAGLQYQQPSGATSGQPSVAPPTGEKEVVMDFMYADWCSHCAAMKPIVAKLVSELPQDRFEIRYFRDEDRPTDSAVLEKFNYYSGKGIFSGFPTFIINDGKDYKAGRVPEAEFRSWVCSQFSSPKPSAC